jgi:hypothetical protein
MIESSSIGGMIASDLDQIKNSPHLTIMDARCGL